MNKEVVLIKGSSRYKNIILALNLIKKSLAEKIKNKSKILIKPNCVSDSIQAASTHVDAIKAVLDFIKPYNKKIMIAEGSAYQTRTAFKNFKYYSLKKDYNVDFVDLNNDKYWEIRGYNRFLQPLKLGISRTMLSAECIISLTLPKTHDSAIATFGIKNVAVGSLIKKTLFPYRVEPRILRKIVNRVTAIRNDKTKIHQGPKAIHKNIFEIYKRVKPNISIIDAFHGMEGNGPVSGTSVRMNLALASTDALAADIVATKLIGLEPENIGYLHYCMDYENFRPNQIKIIGNTTIEKEKRKFKMHATFPQQINWRC